MTTQRESLDTNEKATEASGPTAERTAVNRREVSCASCGSIRYVADAKYEQFLEALSYDPAGGEFVCDECDAEYADDERGQ